jgi:RimJ/RimL family protein N-acetyltransferase
MTKMTLASIHRDGRPEKPGIELCKDAKEMLIETSDFYQRTEFQRPWVSYLGVVGAKPIGICSFKSPPKHSRVEIAYFTFPDEEGRGFATEMARQLIEIARNKQSDIRVIAQTLTAPNASHRVLRKLGFNPVGEIEHPSDGRVLEWLL